MIFQPLIFPERRATISVVSSCKSDDADKPKSRPLRCREGRRSVQSVLQAAQRTRSFYHRRAQRRTSAGCARYSTASGVQKSTQFGWNRGTFLIFSGASSRVLLRGEALFVFHSFQVQKEIHYEDHL
ncbi:hypothetical protein ACNQFG_03985 [Faecalibacterium prausnitzii]|uniref:hypothetical protein n=1 Tax=Faecalibacterium prausnitzii TaxID=853 RepID=UPI003C2F59EA